MPKIIRDALDIIKNNRRLYIILNAVYYGLVIITLLYSLADRTLHDLFVGAIDTTYGSGGPMAVVGDAYLNGKILPAIGITFGVNLVLGSFAMITLPSLVIPFSGLLIAIYRAALWGIIFSPEPGTPLTAVNIGFGVFAAGLILLEGQGYVLTSLAAVLQGRALLSPRTVNEESRWRGYLAGLKITGKLYVLVTLVLLVAALYEVLSIILFPG